MRDDGPQPRDGDDSSYDGGGGGHSSRSHAHDATTGESISRMVDTTRKSQKWEVTDFGQAKMKHDSFSKRSEYNLDPNRSSSPYQPAGITPRVAPAKSSQSRIPIPRVKPVLGEDKPRISKLAEHFEQLSREFEAERLRERRRKRGARITPRLSSHSVTSSRSSVNLTDGNIEERFHSSTAKGRESPDGQLDTHTRKIKLNDSFESLERMRMGMDLEVEESTASGSSASLPHSSVFDKDDQSKGTLPSTVPTLQAKGILSPTMQREAMHNPSAPGLPNKQAIDSALDEQWKFPEDIANTESDTDTIYSLETVDDDAKLQYMQALAHKLAQDISDITTAGKVADTPPAHLNDLLKAFARQLHAESSDPFQREAAVIIHRQRQLVPIQCHASVQLLTTILKEGYWTS